MSAQSSTLLRVSLGLNVALSLTAGATAVMFGNAVAGILGAFPTWSIVGVGCGLLLFAAAIAWTVARLRIGYALAISGLDILWVLTTLPLTLIPGLLSPTGAAIVVILAVVVGALGVLQLLGIRAILKAAATPGQYRHCIRIKSAAEPQKLWQVVANLGTISRYSAGLSASRLEGDGGVGAGSVRVCTNTKGESWAEEVEQLDAAARTVTFRFRSEAEDFPFPLAALSGGWTVNAREDGGALVDVWWVVTPKQRAFGWLVVALMTIPLDQSVPGIVAAMEADAMGRKKAIGRRPALAYC